MTPKARFELAKQRINTMAELQRCIMAHDAAEKRGMLQLKDLKELVELWQSRQLLLERCSMPDTQAVKDRVAKANDKVAKAQQLLTAMHNWEVHALPGGVRLRWSLPEWAEQVRVERLGGAGLRAKAWELSALQTTLLDGELPAGTPLTYELRVRFDGLWADRIRKTCSPLATTMLSPLLAVTPGDVSPQGGGNKDRSLAEKTVRCGEVEGLQTQSEGRALRVSWTAPQGCDQVLVTLQGTRFSRVVSARDGSCLFSDLPEGTYGTRVRTLSALGNISHGVESRPVRISENGA